MTDWDFFRRVLIVAAVATLAVLVWQLSQAFLLFFGSVLLALLLSRAASFIQRNTRFSRGQSLALTSILIVLVVSAIAIQYGGRISGQVADLGQRIPAAAHSFEERFGLGDVSGRLMEQVKSNSGALLFQITSVATFLLSAAANALLVLVAGIFLAAQPELYVRGALKMVPPEQRELMGETLDDAGAALNQWLQGQLLAMAVVGTLIGLGAWYIGLPAPLALGLVAALAEFVPIIGPVVGAIPAVLLAASMDATAVAWTIGLYVVVQQLESNVIMPLIQRSMASVPPVVMMFAILAFAVLFGPLGLLFATPLAVFTYVLVTRLYIRELLDEPAKVPGEKEAALAGTRSAELISNSSASESS
jgi:predicted PurR-regulated permease PerM